MEFAAFESPKLLIASAKENLAEFEAQAAIFAQTCPRAITTRPNQKTGGADVILTLQEKLADRARINAHRIVNDARHALDQATGDAAIELGRENSKDVYFPSGRTSDDFDGNAKRHCRGVHPELVSFIRQLNPYFGGNNELWALCRMAGPNKHQRILSMGLENTSITFQGFPDRPGSIGGGDITFTQVWNAKANELQIAHFGPGIKIDANVAPAIQVTMGEVDVFAGQPATATLQQLVSIAEGVVLGLEAETARIKTLTP